MNAELKLICMWLWFRIKQFGAWILYVPREIFIACWLNPLLYDYRMWKWDARNKMLVAIGQREDYHNKPEEPNTTALHALGLMLYVCLGGLLIALTVAWIITRK
jgi:hypothetical protein